MEFAEVAEALGVPTDQVLSTRPNGDELMAVFTPDAMVEGEKPILWGATLGRDPRSILRELTRGEFPAELQSTASIYRSDHAA